MRTRLKAGVSGALTVIAAMFVIAGAEYASEPARKPFVLYQDIAKTAGLTVSNVFGKLTHKDYILETTGNGAAIFDFDGDGLNDIFIANGTTLEARSGKPPLPQLYRNDGHGKFEDVAAKAGLTQSGWGQGVCAGDYDNDGHTDLFVTFYGHNILYRNTGKGTLVDVTASAKLPVTGTRWGTGCAFLDYDRDGRLDIFVSNYVALDLKSTPKPGDSATCQWKGLAVMCGPTGLPLSVNALYHNNGDGTFTDVSEKAGILKPGGRYGLGVLAADFDGDGWPDIYVACDMTASLLYHNQQDGTFVERGVEDGVAYNYDGRLQAGMGVAAADYDASGRLSIAKTNFSGDLPSLFHNDDGKFFTDVSQAAGLARHQLLGWGALFVDADEDGWPDLMLANGHVYPEVDNAGVGDRYREQTLLYRNSGDGTFSDVTEESGPALRQLRPARGMAMGDIDGDGSPEIVIVNMNEPPALLKNMGAHRHAMVVSLTGTKSNRSAIGARVTVQTGKHTQMQEVLSGGSYLSQNDLALYFGVGDSAAVDRLEVRWPSGLVQRWTGQPTQYKLSITEGQDSIRKERLQGR